MTATNSQQRQAAVNFDVSPKRISYTVGDYCRHFTKLTETSSDLIPPTDVTNGPIETQVSNIGYQRFLLK